MMKKIIAVLMVISICLALCSCQEKIPEEETTDPGEYVLPTEAVDSDISLPYTSADSFNPYSAESSLNRDLIPVLYESLFVSTQDGKGSKQLCKDFESNEKSVTIKLKDKVCFSDGSVLTSADIKKSYSKAAVNKYYKDSLKIFSSVDVIDNSTIRFNFARKDFMVINVLSFPIVKEKGKDILGTGKYSISYLEEIPYLSVNTNHREFDKNWNKQIALYDMAGISGPVYSFKANDISVYKNDLSSGNYINLSSKTVGQSSNNLVYVGINTTAKSSVVSLPWVRQAINIGISRADITAESFLGQGEATVTPFKSSFYALDKADLADLRGEAERAINILERNGYDKVNDDGYRTNSSRVLSLNILVCSKNKYKVSVAQALEASLENLGFSVTIVKKAKLEEFKEALEEGKYSLYIGEIELTPNCDLTPFFSEKGVVNYGIDKEFYSEYTTYKNGEVSVTEFTEAFSTEVPFIPLFYRKSVVSLNPNITGVDEKNIYSSVSNWKMNEK